MKLGNTAILGTLPAYTIFRFVGKNRCCSSYKQVFQKRELPIPGNTCFDIHCLERVGKAWKLKNSGSSFGDFSKYKVTVVEFRKHPLKEPEKTATEKRSNLKEGLLHLQKRCSKLRSHVLGTHPKNMHPISQTFPFRQGGMDMHACIFRCPYCGKTLIASKKADGTDHWQKTSLRIVRKHVMPKQLLDEIVLK